MTRPSPLALEYDWIATGDPRPEATASELLDLLETPGWWPRALCREAPFDWFSTSPEQQASCRAICRACPVRKPCREGAIARAEPYGIWGGLSPRTIRRIRKRRGMAPMRRPRTRGVRNI
jgi:hypothetical protein